MGEGVHTAEVGGVREDASVGSRRGPVLHEAGDEVLVPSISSSHLDLCVVSHIRNISSVRIGREICRVCGPQVH